AAREAVGRVSGAVSGGLPAVRAGGSEPPVLPGPPDAPDSSPAADVLREAARAAQSHPIRPATDQPEPATGEDQALSGDEPQAAREVLASATERLARTDLAELSPAELLLVSAPMRN